jgi:hypothetical protein
VCSKDRQKKYRDNKKAKEQALQATTQQLAGEVMHLTAANIGLETSLQLRLEPPATGESCCEHRAKEAEQQLIEAQVCLIFVWL